MSDIDSLLVLSVPRALKYLLTYNDMQVCDAEDIVQEAVVQILSRSSRPKKMEFFTTWFISICRNLALHFYSRRRLFLEVHSSKNSVKEDATLAYELNLIWEMVTTDADRDLLLGFFWDEDGTKELAARLGCSRSTVYTRLNKAFGRLRPKLEGVNLDFQPPVTMDFMRGKNTRSPEEAELRRSRTTPEKRQQRADSLRRALQIRWGKLRLSVPEPVEKSIEEVS